MDGDLVPTPEALSTMLQLALAHHEAGRLAEAAALYDAILRHTPDHRDTLYLRGTVHFQCGEDSAADGHLSRAIGLGDPKGVYLYQRGLVRERQGRLNEALDDFDAASACSSDFAEAWAGSGRVCLLLEDFSAALSRLERAIALRPDDASLHSNLAQARLALGDVAGGKSASLNALSLSPDSREAQFHLAIALAREGATGEAERAYRDLLRAWPEFVAGWTNLANLLIRDGREQAAIDCLREGIRANPDRAELCFALGVALHELGEFALARVEYESVLKLEPSHAWAVANLASVCRRLGESEEAVAYGRTATELDPNSELAWTNLGNALAEAGALEDARAAYAQVAIHCGGDWLSELRVARVCPTVYKSIEAIDKWRKGFEEAVQALLSRERAIEVARLSTSGCEPPFALAFHGLDDRPIKEMYAKLFEGLIPYERPQEVGGGDRPRVGFLVTDGNEPLFIRSMMGVIGRLNPKRLEVTIACSRGGRAKIAAAIPNESVAILEVPERFDQAVEVLRGARFDLVYFWEVATDSLNYFLGFAGIARRQCTSWGIQVTSGIAQMDAYISSRLIEPEDGQNHYTERLWLLDRLPSYQERRVRPTGTVERGAFGLPEDGGVYACIQNAGKFHPMFDAAIAGILERDGNGWIVVAASGQREVDAVLRARWGSRLGSLAERIHVVPKMQPETYHRLLMVADVMLDPFPFGGVNTTYDGLSFDLPIVTLAGAFQRGRYTTGCYRQMGLDDLVATSVEDYIERAVGWSADRALREEIRERIRSRSDLLFEDASCAEALEKVLLAIVES